MIGRILPVVAGVLLSAGVAQAGNLALSFNDLSAQLAVGQTITEDGRGHSELGVRGLFNNRKDTNLFSAGLDVLGPMGKTGLELGAGVRGYYVDSDGAKISGAGLGALLRFVPPGFSKASFAASLSYCPKIFTGMDGERMLDTEIKAAYEIVPRATAFLSYTEIKANIEDLGERTLDDSLRVGLSLSF